MSALIGLFARLHVGRYDLVRSCGAFFFRPICSHHKGDATALPSSRRVPRNSQEALRGTSSIPFFEPPLANYDQSAAHKRSAILSAVLVACGAVIWLTLRAGGRWSKIARAEMTLSSRVQLGATHQTTFLSLTGSDMQGLVNLPTRRSGGVCQLDVLLTKALRG